MNDDDMETLGVEMNRKCGVGTSIHQMSDNINNNNNDDVSFPQTNNSAHSEQQAHAEMDRLSRALVMLRMIIDAKLETVYSLRDSLQKQLHDTGFILREEQRAASESREALLKLEASTFQDREALRHDVDSLKRMYEDDPVDICERCTY